MDQQSSRKQPGISIAKIIVFAIVASVAGSFVGQYIESSRKVDPQSKLDTAIEEFQSGYDQAALATLKPLADKGNPKAQYWLADIYENGLGVKKDVQTAVGLLEKSATQSFVPAETHLGELYLKGDMTLQNFAKAQSWLRKAAAAGSSSAEQDLGQIFELGLGVPRDLPTAYGWYANAALHGDSLAQHMRDDLVQRMSPDEQTAGEQKSKEIASENKSASH